MRLSDVRRGEEYEYRSFKNSPGEHVVAREVGLPIPGYRHRGVLIEYLSGPQKGKTQTVPARRLFGTWAEASEARKKRMRILEERRKIEGELKRHLAAVLAILERYEIEARVSRFSRYRNPDSFGIVFDTPEQARMFHAVIVAKFGE